jgi:hypothetical protein
MIFDDRISRIPVWQTWLTRITLAVVVGYLGIAAISGFRAIVQVYSVNITAPPTIASGAPITTTVKSSGRVPVQLTLELTQQGIVDTLGAQLVASNRNSIFDPRPATATLRILATPDALSQFVSGPAQLRSVARGRSQFLRVPPPKISVIGVEVRK